jgi:hypothetical protein
MSAIKFHTHTQQEKLHFTRGIVTVGKILCHVVWLCGQQSRLSEEWPFAVQFNVLTAVAGH